MSALSIQPTYPIFTDIDGQPLENGFVWIGTANLDPQVNPINVYWDAALTIPAAQPIRTLAGYPSNSGTPARLYVNSDYSIRVMKKNGSVVYSAPAATERYSNTVISSMNASQVVYDPEGIGAVSSTVQAKLRESMSAQDFGVVGDGVTDDTAALQAAVAAASAAQVTLYISNLTIAVSSSVTMADVSVIYDNATIKAISASIPILIGSNVTFKGDLTVDLNSLANSGIVGNTPDNVNLLGKTTIKNSANGGANFNGGILFAGGTNIHIGTVIGFSLTQSALGTGVYRLVDFSNVNVGSFDLIDNTDGNITCNLFASQNISGGTIRSRNCRTNTCYIINSTQDISIEEIIHESGAGLGLSLDSTVANSRVNIGYLSVTDCVNSLDLRQGGGYQIGTVVIRDGSMADNASGSGVTGLDIGLFISTQTANTAIRSITLNDSTNVRIASGNIHYSVAPLGNRPIDISGTADNFSFSGVITNSLGLGVLASFSTSVAAPAIYMSVITNSTAPSFSYATITDYTTLVLQVNGRMFSGFSSVESLATVPIFELKSLDQTVVLDQVIGEIKTVSSDTSAPGTKFSMRTKSVSATGVTYKTELFDDAGNLVGIVNNSALVGMSIVLPTASTGLPSGAIWNNSGTIAVVP